MNAVPLIRERVVFPDGSMVDMVAWRVPQPVPPSEHPFKYRLVYVVNGKRVLGYDNERGKGDHKHIGTIEEPVVFTSIPDIVDRFIAEVDAMRRPT